MTALYPFRPCVRSGYCCLTAACSLATARGVRPGDRCTFLQGSTAGHYSCGLMERPGDDGEKARLALSAGHGCCSPMNTERQRVITSRLALTRRDP
jgi:hypothetical protein